MGRTLYAGPSPSLVPWLSGCLGCAYDPARHGSAADWSMDVVNTGFHKPKVQGAGALVVRPLGVRDC